MHTHTYRNIWQKGIVYPIGKINELLTKSHCSRPRSTSRYNGLRCKVDIMA